jgi:hypothetical protein
MPTGGFCADAENKHIIRRRRIPYKFAVAVLPIILLETPGYVGF